MSEYTIKTVNGSVVGFDDAENGLPLTKCEVDIAPKVETGTVSGSVVAFSDGADDVSLRSCYSYIETDGRYIISGSTLTDIADAIREKTLIVGPINVNDFVTDIMTIDDSAPDAEEVEF